MKQLNIENMMKFPMTKQIMKAIFSFLFLMTGYMSVRAQSITQRPELYRPQIHFSPKEHWMNDPNGMVYQNGVYHLFFQHYPEGTVWGPMHWGHAISKDLVHFQEQPIALYPDSLGYIFSGSAVVDRNNTSGFGEYGKIPLVAIYTNHDPKGEKAGGNTYQNQSIAYSLDKGKTWTKYEHNPVLRNPGISDFRDPKVMWYEAGKKWIMTLATKDRISFYSSPNLKEWTKESEFGERLGAHGGVWECPDLFTLNYKGQKIWVLVVNINPGGPNGGSATQYFTGSFDGHRFTPDDRNIKWLDYGPDEYAGVTWSNTGKRKIFLGWMSNWDYANVVPTKNWRSAMTIARELGLKKHHHQYIISSVPVKEFRESSKMVYKKKDLHVSDEVMGKADAPQSPYILNVEAEAGKNVSFELSNVYGEKLVVGFDKASNQYYIDRSQAGQTDFKKGFAKRAVAPRLSDDRKMKLALVVDMASVELFADDGSTVMTAIFFPQSLLNQIRVRSKETIHLNSVQIKMVKTNP